MPFAEAISDGFNNYEEDVEFDEVNIQQITGNQDTDQLTTFELVDAIFSKTFDIDEQKFGEAGNEVIHEGFLRLIELGYESVNEEECEVPFKREILVKRWEEFKQEYGEDLVMSPYYVI